MAHEATSDGSELQHPVQVPPVVETAASRAAGIKALLDEWLRDESGYDERMWPELKAAIDRDRSSSRRLFDG
jgi:hypothetical protein